MKSLGLLITVALFVLCMTTAQAQLSTGDIPITASIGGSPLNVTPGALDFANLNPGISYTAPAEITLSGTPQSIVPQTGNGEAATFTETAVTGGAGQRVLVTFALPTKLFGGSLGGTINLTYGANSASWGPSGAENLFFDPRVPEVITLDGTGNGFVVLSANPYPDVLCAGGDALTGDALITVSYTGL